MLIPQPSYVSYTPCCVLADGVPGDHRAGGRKTSFRLTAGEATGEAITDKTKILVLPFPNNPDRCDHGRRKDLEEIAEIIIEKDLFVCCLMRFIPS